MKALSFAGLLSIALIAQAGVAAAETANVCGQLREYRPPTATAPGSVTVSAEQFAIASNAKQTTAAGATWVGAKVCLVGTWQASQTVGRELSDFSLTVASSQAPAALPSTSTGPASPVPLAALLAAAALAVVGGLRVRRELNA